MFRQAYVMNKGVGPYRDVGLQWDPMDEIESWDETVPRCAATTTKGKLCKNHTYDSQLWMYGGEEREVMYFWCEEHFEMFSRRYCGLHQRLLVTEKVTT